MNRSQKIEYLSNLENYQNEYSAVYLVSFSGMDVNDMISFRTELRKTESVTKISKNNIVKIFFDKFNKDLVQYCVNQKLIIFTNDPVGVAKICKKFEKDLERLSPEVAFFDNKLFLKDEIAQVATLPSLDEIRAKIVGLLNAPASKIARIMQQVDQDLISILNQKKED